MRAIAQISDRLKVGETQRRDAPRDDSLSSNPTIDALKLPDAPDPTVSHPSNQASDLPPNEIYTDQPQVVAIGGLLLEFGDGIPQELRSPIAEAMLFAQLAANEVTAESQNVSDWQRQYFQVLAKIGWGIGERVENAFSSSGRNRDLYEKMVPILTTMLAPVDASASKMIAVLRNLGSAREPSPWVTLFNQSSQRYSGGTMEFCHVTADASGRILAKALSCAIQSDESITEVLFFKLSKIKAEIRVTSREMSTTQESLLATKDAISERVRPFVATFVKAAELEVSPAA